mmetsp:Transcript_26770/g.59110  ORF Transcript_26770/g.59110 Transcript_26770/m.59110 type:complete len:744 (+) Transcript_26770:60-2291(+)
MMLRSCAATIRAPRGQFMGRRWFSAPMTMYNKLWKDHVVHEAEDGTCLVYIDRHLVHEVTSPQAFEGLKNAGRQVRRLDCTLATVDHNVPTHSRKNFKDLSSFIEQSDSRLQCVTLEDNVKDFGLTYFGMTDKRQGIVHVIGPEQGFTLPGTTMVCGDSHTATHGAFGSLAFGIGTSEVEHCLATQTLIMKPSKTLCVRVEGELKEGVTSKDVVLHIIGVIGTNGGNGHVIEFAGSVIRDLSMEARMSICNMAIEAGARAGMVAPDEKTFEYLKGRPMAPTPEHWETAVEYWKSLRSDEGAKFDQEVVISAADIAPTVTWGTSPEAVVPITGTVPDPANESDPDKKDKIIRSLEYMGLQPGQKMTDIKIDKVFVGSCTNSRIEDLRQVAEIAQGRKVAEGVHAMIVPGSGIVKLQAEAEGLDKIFVEAGFDWREPGCSMCLGMNPDSLQPRERCASTSNRNFEGRQGAYGRTHLVSPAMAAAAAIKGHLADAREFLSGTAQLTGPKLDSRSFAGTAVPVALQPPAMGAATSEATGMKSFRVTKGIAIPLPEPNVDTDRIIPKQFLKTIHRKGLGSACMFPERYLEDGSDNPDHVFNQEPYKTGKIIVAGDNFGCGSSREHAPWSILDFGVDCIISSSFADIFYNNCFKNGMLPVTVTPAELEKLMEDAKQKKEIEVNLETKQIVRPNGEIIEFDLDEFRRHCLLNGLDDIGLTLQKEQHISTFEEKRADRFPWLSAWYNKQFA